MVFGFRPGWLYLSTCLIWIWCASLIVPLLHFLSPHKNRRICSLVSCGWGETDRIRECSLLVGGCCWRRTGSFVLRLARFGFTGANGNIPKLPVRRQQQPPTSNEHSRIRSVSPHLHEANEQIRQLIWGERECKSGMTNEAHQIQNKQVDNSSQPGPKPKTTTSVDFQKGFLVRWFWWRRPCRNRSVATRCCK